MDEDEQNCDTECLAQRPFTYNRKRKRWSQWCKTSKPTSVAWRRIAGLRPMPVYAGWAASNLD
jgi:hypothetical protein